MPKISSFRKPQRRFKKKKSIFKSRFFWIATLILFVVGTVFYFVFFSDFFQVKEIRISGNQEVHDSDIENNIRNQIFHKFFFFSSKSIFLVNFKKINEIILKKFPQIAQINLRRKFPDAVIIEIKEREPVGVWCQLHQATSANYQLLSVEDCYLFDEKGIAFKKNDRNIESLLFVKDLNKRKEIELGRQVINKKIIKAIQEIKTKLSSIRISIKEFILFSDKRLNVKTSQGWEVYFNPEKDIDWQIKKLNLVLEKQIPLENRKDLEYIDLRFGNLAPFKYK